MKVSVWFLIGYQVLFVAIGFGMYAFGFLPNRTFTTCALITTIYVLSLIIAAWLFKKEWL